jgi:hypothetical protein
VQAAQKASAQAAAQKDADRAAARQKYNAEKARQASIAAANQRAQEDAQEKIRIQASIRTAEKAETVRLAALAKECTTVTTESYSIGPQLGIKNSKTNINTKVGAYIE